MISKYKNFILYVLLGGIGALTDLLLYSFLVNIEINYQLANFIGYFLGGIVSFTLNKTYNFKVKNNTLHRFSKYFMVAFIGYIISVLILFLLVDIFKVDIIVSKIFTLMFIVFIQFSLNKRYTFNNTDKDSMLEEINFDDYTASYNSLIDKETKFFEDLDYFTVYKINIIKELLKTKKIDRILEYGCGIGKNISFLDNSFSNSKIYGCDISKDSLSIASENKNCDFFHTDYIEKYNDFFDLIFISGVYHHIPLEEREKVTTDIKRMLKKDGYIIIFEHNPYNPITQKIVNSCEFDRDAILLTSKNLKEYFSDKNCKLEKSAYTLFFPKQLSFLRPLEKYLEKVPCGGQHYVLYKKIK